MRAHSTNHHHFTVQVIKARRRRRRRRKQQQQHIHLLPKGCVLEQYKMPFLFRTKYGANCWHAKKKYKNKKRNDQNGRPLPLSIQTCFVLTHSLIRLLACLLEWRTRSGWTRTLIAHTQFTSFFLRKKKTKDREKREKEKNSRAKSAKPSFPNVGLRLGRCFCCWAERNLECAYI